MAKMSVIHSSSGGPGGAGHGETFEAGDCFANPTGSSRTWHMLETTRKHDAIFDAKTAGA